MLVLEFLADSVSVEYKFVCLGMHGNPIANAWRSNFYHGMATISRLLKITGLF